MTPLDPLTGGKESGNYLNFKDLFCLTITFCSVLITSFTKMDSHQHIFFFLGKTNFAVAKVFF